MSRHGIPTKHKGRQFRSRLEARWATFFDLVGWKYEYEPFDLMGWIPDFLILGETPVLVEVKPVYSIPMDVAKKILDSEVPNEYEAMILGCVVPVPEDPDLAHLDDESAIGWLGNRKVPLFGDYSKHIFMWAPALIRGWRQGSAILGFYHGGFRYGSSENPGRDRISGGPADQGEIANELLCSFWTEAGNKVQWSAPR